MKPERGTDRRCPNSSAPGLPETSEASITLGLSDPWEFCIYPIFLLNPEVNPDWVLSVQQKSFHHTLWGQLWAPVNRLQWLKRTWWDGSKATHPVTLTQEDEMVLRLHFQAKSV